MIATAGDTIIAGESSLTGSIGVIFQYPQIQPLLDKLGVSLQEIKSSPLKAEPSPFHPASEEAKAMISNMVMDSYAWFVDLVADRRKLPRDETLKLADGTIFTGRQAVKLKLVDPDRRRHGNPRLSCRRETSARTCRSSIGTRRAPRLFCSLGLFPGLQYLLGYDDLMKSQDMQGILPQKLLLDGLVSVWQVGRD